ncbi:hypothetical protein IMSAGC019_01193 [Lachnospiraceae bacterium]|nr:hypothetical protein IMSAGC019_01193 [Lachnospiraceae bacterium]
MSFGAERVEIMTEIRIMGIVIDFAEQQKEKFDLLH